MAAYFIFTFISIKNRKTVNYYEVEEGSLVKEHSYTGLIIRTEEIVNSQAAGTIYYYVADGRKVAAGSPVYSIDEGGDLANYLSTHTDELSNANSSRIMDIRTQLLTNSRTFSNSSFSSLYEIRDSIEAKVTEYASLSIFNNISDDLRQAGINYQTFNSEKNGTLCCYTDGYEDIDENNLSAELFDQTAYAEARKQIKAGSMINAGDPAYKLITNENFVIAFQLTEEEAEEMREDTVLKVKFTDKNFTAKLPFKIVYGTDGGQYGVLTMSSYLVQFTGDRFIDFEIITNDVSGLKIPDKAITTKSFYIIPEAYMDTDAGGNTGFHKAVVGDGGTADQFVITDIYAVEDGYCYIECSDEAGLQPGDFILLPAGHVLTDAGEGGSGNKPSEAAAVSAAGAEESQDEASGESMASGQDEDGENASSEAEASETEAEETETAAETEHAGASDPEDIDAQADSSDNEDAEDIARRDDMGDEDTEEERDAEDADAAPENEDSYAEESRTDEGSTDTEPSSAPIMTAAGGMYQIGPMKELKGVYNINKGYTVFRRVEVLESANGYSIVKKNSSYGLSTYDHIVLDTDQVSDDQLLYR